MGEKWRWWGGGETQGNDGISLQLSGKYFGLVASVNVLLS